MGFDVTLPLRLNQSHVILTGVAVDKIETKIDGRFSEQIFSALALKVGVNKIISDRLSCTVLLIPRWSANSSQLNSESFQVGGLGFLKFNQSDRKNFRLGIYYNNEFFGPFIVPLAGFYYLSKNNKTEINVMLPNSADINHQIVGNFYAGLNFTGQIRSFFLKDFSGSDGYIVKSTNELSSYLKMTISSKFIVQARVGYSLSRSYRLYNENDKLPLAISFVKIGDQRSQLNDEFNNGIIFHGQLIYRLATQ